MISFPAFTYRQSENGPIIVTFVAASSSIDRWAKTPTRLSNKPHQFQRAEIPSHVQDIKKFFHEDPSRSNSSPTAILIGVEPDSIGKIHLHDTAGKVLDEGSIGRRVLACSVEVDFDPWDSSLVEGGLDEELQALYARVRPLYARAAAQEEEDEDVSEADEAADDTEGDASQEVGDADEVDEDATVEEPEAEADAKFLASIGLKRLISICDRREYRTWSDSRKRALVELFKDELKPCLIIDGQHRIKGTKSLADVPFTVSFLPRADWSELAFQFIVNNSSAKKVDENLLFGIVGQSLSPQQLERTEARLNRAGIKVSLIKAAMRVQLEPNPFVGMLKTNTPGEPGFLDATAMQKKVIELWYGSRGKNGTRPTFKSFQALKEDKRKWSMGELFSSVSSGLNAVDRARDWQDNHWFDYFKAFWEAVSEHFKPRLWPEAVADWLPTESVAQAFTPEQRERQKLMRATVLGLLQKAILQAWADHQFKILRFSGKGFDQLEISPAQLKEEISNLVKQIPMDFFTELKYTGFDASKDLREDMTRQMLYVVQLDKKFADIKANHQFWTKGK